MKKLTQNTMHTLLALALLMALNSDALAGKKKKRTPKEPPVVEQPAPEQPPVVEPPVEEPAPEEPPVEEPTPTEPPVEEPSPEEPAPADDAQSSVIRTEIANSGLYKVTAAQIAATLGGSESAAAAAIADGNVRVSSMGSDVAWLKANNSVYFYGEEIGGMYGGNNVYWLELGVSGPQMATAKARAPRKAAPGGVFTDTVLFEEDHVARPNLCYGENDDFWFWKELMNPYGDTETTFPCQLDEVATVGGTAQIQVSLKGGVDSATTIDHHVRVFINDTFIAETQMSGLDDTILTSSFSQALLHSGNNDVRIEALLPTGAPYSIVFVDGITINYLRNYAASTDCLKLKGSENRTVTVDGFSSAGIEVLDLTNPLSPRLNGGTKIEGTQDGYRVSFQPSASTTPYLAASLAAANAPAALTIHVDTGLANAANAASYVVIAPASLASAATELAAYRQTQGMTTKVVTLDAIYDEFNSGVRDPLAIQAFLAHAVSQWTEAPRYVVLAGQGSYDYKNALGNNDCLVPSLMVYTPSGLISSDSRYSDLDNDGAPDLAIGRLPVLTAAELLASIDKIRNYELGGTWKDTVQMIADNDDSAGYYASDSETAAALLPAGLTAQKAYLNQSSFADVRASALQSIQNGCGIFNYVGHGLGSKLAAEGIVTSSDISSMTNADRAPVMLAMACHVGRFGMPGYDGLAEGLLRKTNGGAVAVWGASGLAYSAESRVLNIGFYEAMNAGSTRLGDAVNGGLTKYRNEGHMSFMRYVYNLLGDPATVISSNNL